MTLIHSNFRASNQSINFSLDYPAPGNLDIKWIHGSISAKHNKDPEVQVHPYNEHT